MEQAPTKGTLAFGVVTNDPARRSWLKSACEVLSRKVGAVVYPQVARSYPDLSAAISGGTVDLAWTPPLVAANLMGIRAVTVVAVSRRDNAAQYRSIVFVRRDSGIGRAEDLRDKHVAWVDRTSASGYVVPCIWLRDHALDPETLFARQSFLGTHGAVARAVLGREADAGATFALFSSGLRATVEAGWTEIDPSSADEVRMLINAGSVPADCIAASTRLGKEMCARLEHAFCGLAEQDVGVFRKALGADGYLRCPADYMQSLRRLELEASRAVRRSIAPPSRG
ncbi:MAG: PhnD/SsuA/transferrin family substrate-binding protein [Polyangiaceae bacterium]